MKDELKRKLKSFSDLSEKKTAETRSPDLEVYIEDDWKVSDLVTVEDCDRARDHLTGIVAGIEQRIATVSMDYATYARTKSALRWKKRAMQLVQQKRADISKQARYATQETRDRRIIGLFKALYPEQFQRVADVLKQQEEAQL